MIKAEELNEEVQDVKKVWIVMTTKDKTEGRTPPEKWKVCETLATARRVGLGNYVMGSNCPIEEGLAVKVKGIWFYPGPIEKATEEDKVRQKKLDDKESLEERLKALGVSEDDLKILRS